MGGQGRYTQGTEARAGVWGRARPNIHAHAYTDPHPNPHGHPHPHQGLSDGRMDCCTSRAFPGPAWFGQIPGQTNAGPLSRMTSPISLMTKWRRSSPSGVPAGSGAAQYLHRHCSWCPRHGPRGSLATLGGRVLMLPAPARAGVGRGPYTRGALGAGCAAGAGRSLTATYFRETFVCHGIEFALV